MKPPDSETTIDRDLLADLYLSDRGLHFLEELVERFGSRFGGSAEERAAAAWIRDVLQAHGVPDVALVPFETRSWERGETTLELKAPQRRTLPVLALPFSPAGVVEAPLVYLGDGHPQAFTERQEEIAGSIVMVTTANPRFYPRPMHRKEKINRALLAGARAVIWMRGEPGGAAETGFADFGKPATIPVVGVSYETGHTLLRQLKRGPVILRVEVHIDTQAVTAFNVVGNFEGTERPDEMIVVGGHYDGHDISPSAVDNGAGTAVLVEVARGLARHASRLRRTVQIVAFGQEELGLVGSAAYVKHLLDQDANVRFMLNLDGAGRGGPPVLMLQGWPESVAWFKKLFEGAYEANVTVGDRIALYSDMFSFALHGFPSAQYASAQPVAGGAPRGFDHTPWDTLDKVSGPNLQVDAARVARLVYRLATLEDLPFRRKRPTEVRGTLATLGLDEVLRIEGRPLPEAAEP